MDEIKQFLTETKIRFTAKRNENGCWVADHYDYRGYEDVRNLRHETYETLWGPIPEDAVLNLDCGYSRCYNPEHMTPDTDRCGAKNGRAKIEARHVWCIRDMVAAGEMTQKQAVELSGLAKSTMSAILSRKTWRHV
ncbi:MAG TPA: hypothetical protein EYF98_07105 [Planctomycetes bacterium]|nr:hypothetical protein [Planctomycetota bacterium]